MCWDKSREREREREREEIHCGVAIFTAIWQHVANNSFLMLISFLCWMYAMHNQDILSFVSGFFSRFPGFFKDFLNSRDCNGIFGILSGFWGFIWSFWDSFPDNYGIFRILSGFLGFFRDSRDLFRIFRILFEIFLGIPGIIMGFMGSHLNFWDSFRDPRD